MNLCVKWANNLIDIHRMKIFPTHWTTCFCFVVAAEWKFYEQYLDSRTLVLNLRLARRCRLELFDAWTRYASPRLIRPCSIEKQQSFAHKEEEQVLCELWKCILVDSYRGQLATDSLNYSCYLAKVYIPNKRTRNVILLLFPSTLFLLLQSHDTF